LIFAGSKHRKDRFFKGETSFHDAATPLCSTDYFSDAETPRCSTVHFSNAETPLKNTGHCSPTPKHLCSALFTSSQSQKTSHSPIILTPETTPSSTCFVLSSPSFSATPFAATFPVAETQIVSNFSSVSPMLKHHCSAFFIPFHPLFHPLIDENNSVQQLFRLFAETPSFSTSFIHVAQTPFPSNLPTFILNAETPSFSTI
jgi:hypothetical protein